MYSQLGSVGQPGSLAVDAIGAGTLFAYLKAMFDVGGAVLTVYEHREFLGGFVTQFIEGLKLMQSRGGQPPLPAFRMAIEAMSAPIRTGRATQLTLNVEGDNNRIFVIDAQAAANVQIYLDSQPRSARLRNDQPKLADQVLRRLPVDQQLEKPSQELSVVKKGRRVAEDIERILGPDRRPRVRSASSRDDGLKPLPAGRIGTLLSLGGVWLVRPEGYSGGLFPIDPKTLDVASLSPETKYLVEGQVSAGRYIVASVKSGG
jgi:hypothetical protein